MANIELIAERSGIYGGLHRLYVLATYFNEAGHTAVVNIADKSCNTWFKHNVVENTPIHPQIRIMPETWQKPHPTATNILYVQAEFDPPQDKHQVCVTTTMHLKEHVANYTACNAVIPYGIDSSIWKSGARVKGRVGYMPRKNASEVSIIKSLTEVEPLAKVLGIHFYPIDGVNMEKAAEMLRSCDIFLAVSRTEGFGLPPFEAMLSGCVVIGYHGQGGKQWMTPETHVSVKNTTEFVPAILNAAMGRYEEIRSGGTALVKDQLTMREEKAQWLKFISTLL